MPLSLKDLERMFKAIANKRRLEILRFLRNKREATVGVIAEHIKLSFKSTSRHLSVLFSAGILEREQRSVEAYYSISGSPHELIRRVISNL